MTQDKFIDPIPNKYNGCYLVGAVQYRAAQPSTAQHSILTFKEKSISIDCSENFFMESNTFMAIKKSLIIAIALLPFYFKGYNQAR